MSNLGKVFCVISIISSLAAGVLGFMLSNKKTGYATQLTAVEDALRKAPAPVQYTGDFKLNTDEPAATVRRANDALDKTKTELASTQKSLSDTQGQLTTSQAEVQKLTTDITATKRDLETKTTRLAEVEKKVAEVEGSLKSMNDKLGGRSLDDVLTSLNDTTEKMKVLGAEKKIIEDSLAQMQKDLNKFQELDRLRDDGRAPMELSGRVLAINKQWNFVVLDVGKDDKLVEGVDLTVYRGETLIGKIKTVSVESNTAIADILPDWTKTEIQVGDKVLF
jgi:predicted  nucleic acid-binding Zn-ribbon protein